MKFNSINDLIEIIFLQTFQLIFNKRDEAVPSLHRHAHMTDNMNDNLQLLLIKVMQI